VVAHHRDGDIVPLWWRLLFETQRLKVTVEWMPM
jgi:hypothetical protein